MSIGQRWNEARVCAKRLDPLIKVTNAFLNRDQSVSTFLDDASITEEIERLLFSDGPDLESRALWRYSMGI